jgi:uncharacterized protein (TIGR00645 family)
MLTTLFLWRKEMTEGHEAKIDQPKKMTVQDRLGDYLFESRWLLYPMNIGLALAGAAYVLRFLYDDYLLLRGSIGMDAEGFMVPLLGLVDMVMIANLLVMIYQGSHQIFIRRLYIDNAEERPQWLDHVDSGILKLKIASSVAGITLIRLLKDFVDIEHMEWKIVLHRAIIHGVCLVSCIVMAWVWRITHPTAEGKH